MKRFLVFVVIICMAFLLIAGAQETVEPEEAKEEVQEEALTQPAEMLVTRLDITLIDETGDHKIKLENAIVQIIGELHIAGDTITYSDTFTEGDMYEMVIWIKQKK